MKDLVVLIADNNMESALNGLLSRTTELRMRRLDYDTYVHPERDPGCLLRGHHFLRPLLGRYRNALLMFDREGCGQAQKSRLALENQVENLLSSNGWTNRAAAIVFDPELEVWVWSDSPDVDSVLGWAARDPDLRTWLVAEQLAVDTQSKPRRPKEAVERALYVVRKPRSSSIYLQLARMANFDRCVDPAFTKFKSVLRNWFGHGVRE